jgi:hypothetical protein
MSLMFFAPYGEQASLNGKEGLVPESYVEIADLASMGVDETDTITTAVGDYGKYIGYPKCSSFSFIKF